MSNTTDAVPGFDFSLAGSWWKIPVSDEAEADRAIEKIVFDTAGRADQLATFRHLAREQLAKTVADARQVDARYLYLAREIAPGLPLSGSLGIYWPKLSELPDDVAESPKLARAFLKASLHESDSAGKCTDEQEFEVPAGAVLRRCYRSERELDDGTVVETVRADYWLTSPHRGRFVLFSFSSQYATLEEPLRGLFDAIVGTVQWKGASAQPIIVQPNAVETETAGGTTT